jgi:hypothetical protein
MPHLFNSAAQLGADGFREDLATLGELPEALLDPFTDDRWHVADVYQALEDQGIAVSDSTIRAWLDGYYAAAWAATLEDGARAIVLSLGCAALDARHDPATDAVRIHRDPDKPWTADASAVCCLGDSFLGLTADEECEFGHEIVGQWLDRYGPAHLKTHYQGPPAEPEEFPEDNEDHER